MPDDIRNISINEIIDPQNPMRSELDRATIFELAESIKREGLINPITVRPRDGKFEVVAGHRRFVACKLAGLSEISCVVRELDDDQAAEVMVHENLERQDVDPVDEALLIGRIVGSDEAKIPGVAKRLNRSEQWVEDRLNILTYPDYMLPPLRSGRLKLGVAKWLATVEDDVYRRMWVESAINQGMTVLQAEVISRQAVAGVYAPSADIMPDTSGVGPQRAAKARAMCARCGQVAEEPNLRNVFIHVTCPDEAAGAEPPPTAAS